MSYPQRYGNSLYQQTRVQGGVEGADRHRLIALLLDGLIERIHQARGHIVHQDVPAKGKAFSKAVGILGELRRTLDHSVAPEVTGRLERLYAHVTRRLLHAQLNDDLGALDESMKLIEPIRTSWHAIRESFMAEQAKLEAKQQRVGG